MRAAQVGVAGEDQPGASGLEGFEAFEAARFTDLFVEFKPGFGFGDRGCFFEIGLKRFAGFFRQGVERSFSPDPEEGGVVPESLEPVEKRLTVFLKSPVGLNRKIVEQIFQSGAGADGPGFRGGSRNVQPVMGSSQRFGPGGSG